MDQLLMKENGVGGGELWSGCCFVSVTCQCITYKVCELQGDCHFSFTLRPPKIFPMVHPDQNIQENGFWELKVSLAKVTH